MTVAATFVAVGLIAAWPVVYVLATERLLDRTHRRTVSLHSRGDGGAR